MEKTRPRVRAVARAGMAALRQAGGGVEKAHDRHHSMACSVGRNWLGWLVRSAQSHTHHNHRTAVCEEYVHIKRVRFF